MVASDGCATRESTGAIMTIINHDNAQLACDKGGEGWWPLDAPTPEAS